MSPSDYRIKVIKGDFQFEAEGDKSFVLEMINRFEGGIPTISKKPEKGSGKKVESGSRADKPMKSISVGEFVRQIGVKKHTDIVLVFGYYLEKFSGLTEFTVADINTCYYDSKMESSNTSQMIINNIKRGLIMEAKRSEKKKKSFLLTRTGEEFVKSLLSNEVQ